jgi:hypothetical protein
MSRAVMRQALEALEHYAQFWRDCEGSRRY